MLRKRRLIIIVFSLFPLLLASVALAVMATPNKDKEDATLVASAIETAAAAPLFQIDVPAYAPTSQAPSQSSDETHHSRLRPTISPTYRPDLILSQQITTTSPTITIPTSGPPTTTPTDYCVKSGVPCPNKKLGVNCCSGACEKNKETGEKVCAWIPEMTVVEITTPSPTNSAEAWDEEEVYLMLP